MTARRREGSPDYKETVGAFPAPGRDEGDHVLIGYIVGVTRTSKADRGNGIWFLCVTATPRVREDSIRKVERSDRAALLDPACV